MSNLLKQNDLKNESFAIWNNYVCNCLYDRRIQLRCNFKLVCFLHETARKNWIFLEREKHSREGDEYRTTWNYLKLLLIKRCLKSTIDCLHFQMSSIGTYKWKLYSWIKGLYSSTDLFYFKTLFRWQLMQFHRKFVMKCVFHPNFIY